MNTFIKIFAILHASLYVAGAANSQSLTLDQRIKYKMAIDEIYHRHRVWPKDNPRQKPNFDSTDKTVFSNKVDTYLQKSYALSSYWQRPIMPNQLQSELQRIVRESKQRGMLQEIFAALDNDPYVIAECLARPLLADRLIRDFYYFDERFHGHLKKTATRELELLSSSLRMSESLTGQYQVVDWVLSDSVVPQKANEINLSSIEWEQKITNLISIFGQKVSSSKNLEKVLPIGRFSVLQEEQDRFYVSTVLLSEQGHVRIGTYTWLKRSFDDWWQTVSNKMPTDFFSSQQYFQFELPKIEDPIFCTDDTWTTVTGPEVGERYSHTAIWTGSEMIIWGGNGERTLDTGARYDPATDTWSAISSINAPSPRFYHTAIWTGSRMIIWGGQYDWATTFNTGASYDPITDSWSTISITNAPEARYGHTAVWTNQEMIVWGGTGGGYYNLFNTGGRYNPFTDSWSSVSITNAPRERIFQTAVWNGTEMIIWGGEICDVDCDGANTGARYNPSTDSWTEITTDNAPEARAFHTAIFTGVDMIIWGGARWQPVWTTLNTGAKYNSATNSWTAISMTDVPQARWGHTMIWTSEEAIIWGGSGQPNLDPGGRYNPQTDSWIPMTNVNQPIGRLNHTAIWTSTEMIIWGGLTTAALGTRTGGRYDPISDSWVPTAISDPNIPSSRKGYSMIWTGAESIVWGGFDGSYTNSGSRYDPATNNWTLTSNTLVPEVRTDFTAVWTGTEMVIWGGWRGDWPTLLNSGGRYDPATDSWTPTNLINAPPPQILHTAIWTGSEMIIWGQYPGGRYDPFTDTWSSISNTNAPPNRPEHSAIWTGNEMIIWGGTGYSCYDDGGRYDPSKDKWKPITKIFAPSPRRMHTAVWTGAEMIIWGGEDCNLNSLSTGGRYNPVTNKWTFVNNANAPDARQRHTAIWTGSEMVIWGGLLCYSGSCISTDTGARYSPYFDQWKHTTIANAPSWRYGHKAIWDSTQMMVWGPGSDGGLYCAGAMFSDDFEDGILSDQWNYRNGSWIEANGQLIATPIKKKTIAIASVFSGCRNCEISAAIQSSGGPLSSLSLFGWYQDQWNNIELQIKPETDKWILKQRVNGVVVAKQTKILEVDAGISYELKLSFDGDSFKLFVNDSPVLSMIKAFGSAPFGTIAFQIKNSTGALEYISAR